MSHCTRSSFSSAFIPSELIDTDNLGVVLVSPRIRAQKTFHILVEHLPEVPKFITTEDVREWDYGDYEGLLTHEIKAKREDPNWNIWVDGCLCLRWSVNIFLTHTPSCHGGESAEEMTTRVDSVI